MVMTTVGSRSREWGGQNKTLPHHNLMTAHVSTDVPAVVPRWLDNPYLCPRSSGHTPKTNNSMVEILRKISITDLGETCRGVPSNLILRDYCTLISKRQEMNDK